MREMKVIVGGQYFFRMINLQLYISLHSYPSSAAHTLTSDITLAYLLHRLFYGILIKYIKNILLKMQYDCTQIIWIHNK